MKRGVLFVAAIAASAAVSNTVAAASNLDQAAETEAAAVRHPAQVAARLAAPASGDWEGAGPHGLSMSFDLVRRGRSERLRNLAVSLPTGCRVGASPSFYTTYFSNTHYFPPTRYPELILRSVFEIKPAGDFAIVGVNTTQPKFPLVLIGSFKSPRAGTVAVPAYPLKCKTGGWPRTVHFVLHAGRRLAVNDGTYSGSLVGPAAGIAGTVSATVVAGGRVLTDFTVSWICPSSDGRFELGPSPATGEFVGPNGAVEEHWTPAGIWSAYFASDGQFAGTVSNATSGDCTQGQSVGFAAALNPG